MSEFWTKPYLCLLSYSGILPIELRQQRVPKFSGDKPLTKLPTMKPDQLSQLMRSPIHKIIWGGGSRSLGVWQRGRVFIGRIVILPAGYVTAKTARKVSSAFRGERGGCVVVVGRIVVLPVVFGLWIKEVQNTIFILQVEPDLILHKFEYLRAGQRRIHNM